MSRLVLNCRKHVPVCRPAVLLSLFASLLAPCFITEAQEISSENYVIEASALAGGGGESRGAGLALTSVLGQSSTAGTAASDKYLLESGVTAQAISLTIDIKPEDASNRINPVSYGLIAVAILSGASFSAVSEVDGSSITFGRTGNEESRFLCHDEGEDVNLDGILDLVCHFETQLTGFSSGDTQGFLSAFTNDGGSILLGGDSIAIVGN